ncbi:MAG TPA: HAMP domain-containing sensor histidine kinase [Rhodopila sp.]|nr:HAMP domain-containing sensor histidine kinase [Rhodopila sp.]
MLTRPASRVARAIVPPRMVRASRWMVPLIWIACGVAFAFDLGRDNVFAYGIVYTPLVCTAVFYRSRRAAWVLAAIAIAMVILGAFLPVVNSDLPDMIGNRFLSILAIIAAAVFMNFARTIQERLAVETRRAEEAERIKGEVLDNLSEEIRTPLHGLLGLMALLKAAARGDQQESLEQVHASTEHLLHTIDDLIDLTQIEERPLASEAVDLSTVAHQAAEEASRLAREHAIDIRVSCPQDVNPARRSGVRGDSWAIRRIIDNLLVHQISQAQPGETVSIIVKRNGDNIAASVAGPVAADMAEASGDGLGAECEESWWLAGSARLALCHRLARGMNGKLLVAGVANDDAMITLSLPAT